MPRRKRKCFEDESLHIVQSILNTEHTNQHKLKILAERQKETTLIENPLKHVLI